MSSGIVHSRASYLLSGAFLLSGIYVVDTAGLQMSLGALVGVIVTPDLDVDKGFIADRLIRQKIGNSAELLWDIFWYPYKKSMKHGSPLSHWPIVSTLGRLLYIYTFGVVAPLFVLSLFTGADWLTTSLDLAKSFILSYHNVILGLIGSDIIHFVLDITFTDTSNGKVMFGFIKLGYNRRK